jgi:hypothetical protein
MSEHHQEAATALFGADAKFENLKKNEQIAATTVGNIQKALPHLNYASIITIIKMVCATGAFQTLCAAVNGGSTPTPAPSPAPTEPQSNDKA